MLGKSSPENILKEVDIYLSDTNAPDYVAIQVLNKGIKAYPDNKELKEKLKELEAKSGINVHHSSPKILYAVLVITISLMGLGLLYTYFTGKTYDSGLYIGISFLLIALIIFNQYRKEK